MLLFQTAIKEGKKKMKKLLHKIEKGMDHFKIKKKLYMLYIICVLIPIVITDSVVFFIVRSSENENQQHEMANIANAVSYSISSTVNSMGKFSCFLLIFKKKCVRIFKAKNVCK